MKKQLLFIAALSLSSASVFAAASIFKKIPEQAQVANGSADIKKYDSSLSKKELERLGLEQLKKDYWENCGPWKTTTSRRAAIKAVQKVEAWVDDTEVAAILEKLYKEKRIVAAVGAISNNEVECSLSWFNFYGSDGTVIELRYNLGD